MKILGMKVGGAAAPDATEEEEPVTIEAPKPLTPVAPVIAEKITKAEQELAVLDREHGEAALDAELGREGASEKLQLLARQQIALRERLTNLRSAHQQARLADARAARRARAGIARAQ